MRGKKEKADQLENKEDKFDNWYLDNEKLMQEAEDKKNEKIIKKQQKRQARIKKAEITISLDDLEMKM